MIQQHRLAASAKRLGSVYHRNITALAAPKRRGLSGIETAVLSGAFERETAVDGTIDCVVVTLGAAIVGTALGAGLFDAFAAKKSRERAP